MSDIKDYNVKIAQILDEQQALQKNAIEQMLFFCNKNQLNLAQFLIQKNMLPPQYVAKIIKMIHTGENLSTTGKSKCSQDVVEPQKSVVAKNIGKYEVLSELGRGGMGVVYKVRQPGINRILVLKTLLGNVSSHPISVKRFYKEAQAISSLKHPNIIPIYDFGEENGFPYFVMQFIDGMDFQELIDADTCKKTELIDILIKIAHALDYAHKNNIIHRDVKPANVFLDKDHKPYLADFGLAKTSDKASSLTKSGAVIGTPFYLAPEQVRGHRKHIDHRADIYALGVILYKIVCGKFPFIDSRLPGLYKKIQEDIPIAPRKVDNNIDEELNFICLKTIARKAEDRYQSAANFAEALEKYRTGEKQPLGKEHMILTTKMWWGTYKKMIGAIAAIAITLVVALGWWQASNSRISTATKMEQIYYAVYDLVQQQEYDSALQKISSVTTKDAHLIALKGHIYQKMGDTKKAKMLFAVALKKKL
ncbi:serine/threonine protein kinase [Candidatus Uabimicrobium sp. HlEnr_7]|uniref:serine/threonine protein kinase n=1 Tax=Candidatus Uabimicrobium helgolandensis TaxID=3095367 RepID=UPI0035567E8F